MTTITLRASRWYSLSDIRAIFVAAGMDLPSGIYPLGTVGPAAMQDRSEGRPLGGAYGMNLARRLDTHAPRNVRVRAMLASDADAIMGAGIWMVS